jgi:hypothetical protein
LQAQFSTQTPGAFLHANDTKMAAVLPITSQWRAVIVDGDLNGGVMTPNAQANVRSVGVAQGVGDGFLANAVDGRDDIAG